jgi:hypothetical protein
MRSEWGDSRVPIMQSQSYGEARTSLMDIRSQVEALGDSLDWSQLTPNAPSATDLLPAEVSGKDLATIYDVITAMPGFSGGALDDKTEILRHHANELIDLGDVGQLSFVDAGQAKAFWRWTRHGKSMALGIEFDSNYVSREGRVSTPSDPNIVPMGAKQYERYSEYSDLRTYARVPVGDHVIRFQEFGEALSSSEALDRSRIEEARVRTRENILRVAPSADIAFSNDELQHERHYLKKEGYDGLFAIDIPIKEVFTGELLGQGHTRTGTEDVDAALKADAVSDEQWLSFAAGNTESKGDAVGYERAAGALGRMLAGRRSSYIPRHAHRK